MIETQYRILETVGSDYHIQKRKVLGQWKTPRWYVLDEFGNKLTFFQYSSAVGYVGLKINEIVKRKKRRLEEKEKKKGRKTSQVRRTYDPF